MIRSQSNRSALHSLYFTTILFYEAHSWGVLMAVVVVVALVLVGDWESYERESFAALHRHQGPYKLCKYNLYVLSSLSSLIKVTYNLHS